LAKERTKGELKNKIQYLVADATDQQTYNTLTTQPDEQPSDKVEEQKESLLQDDKNAHTNDMVASKKETLLQYVKNATLTVFSRISPPVTLQNESPYVQPKEEEKKCNNNDIKQPLLTDQSTESQTEKTGCWKNPRRRNCCVAITAIAVTIVALAVRYLSPSHKKG